MKTFKSNNRNVQEQKKKLVFHSDLGVFNASSLNKTLGFDLQSIV